MQKESEEKEKKKRNAVECRMMNRGIINIQTTCNV